MVDHFGNVILDLYAETLAAALDHPLDGDTGFKLDTPNGPVTEFHTTYGAAANRPFLLINSSGYLEIAIAGGHAGRTLNLEAGQTLTLTLGA